MLTGIWPWLTDLISGTATSVSDVWRKVQHFWDLIRHIFGEVTHGWAGLSHEMGRALGWVEHHAAVVGGFARDIYHHFVPAAVGWAIAKATAWAERQIVKLETWATNWINSVVQWTGIKLTALQQWATQWVNGVVKWVKGIEAYAYNVGAIVLALLTDPNRLAEWLGGAIIKPVLRSIWAHRRAIGDLLLRTLLASMLASTDLIESVIADVL